MSDPRDKSRPMAGKDGQRPGADVGGIRETADAGLGDALERRAERRDEDPRGRAATGEGFGAATAPHPRVDLGGKSAPGSAGSTSGASERSASEDRATPVRGEAGGAPTPDDEDEWRHEPVAPVDESPLKSLGRSVSEVVTGTLDDATGKPKP